MGDAAVGDAGDAGPDRGDGARWRTTSIAAGALGLLVVARRGPHRRRRQPGAVARRRRTTSSSRWPRAVRDHAGTTLEFIPAMGEIPDERIELMADMSLAANRPLNWNLLGSLSPTEIYEQQLDGVATAPPSRAPTWSRSTLPDLMRMRGQPHARRPAGLARGRGRCRAERAPARRRRSRDARDGCATGAEAAATAALGALARLGADGDRRGRRRRRERCVGRTIADIAAERGVDPSTCCIDVVLPDRLPLTMVLPVAGAVARAIATRAGGAGRGVAGPARRARRLRRRRPPRPDVPRQLPDASCSARSCATAGCSRSRRRSAR